MDLTVGEGIKQLSTLCVTEIKSEGKVLCSSIPEPRLELEKIITTTGVIFPEILKKQGAHVVTKKEPPSRRKNQKISNRTNEIYRLRMMEKICFNLKIDPRNVSDIGQCFGLNCSRSIEETEALVAYVLMVFFDF